MTGLLTVVNGQRVVPLGSDTSETVSNKKSGGERYSPNHGNAWNKSVMGNDFLRQFKSLRIDCGNANPELTLGTSMSSEHDQVHRTKVQPGVLIVAGCLQSVPARSLAAVVIDKQDVSRKAGLFFGAFKEIVTSQVTHDRTRPIV